MKAGRLWNFYHYLQAKYALLKAQIEGLKEAVHAEKRYKKPKKALFTELRGTEGNNTILSSAKVAATWELQAEKAKEAEEAQAQKVQR